MDRSIPWWRVAVMTAIFSFSLPTFVSGLELARASSSAVFLPSLLCSGVILSVIAAFMGVIGSESRLSSYMLSRIAFGTKGSMVMNLSFGLSLLGWFGVNINLFANATASLLKAMGHYSGPVWPLELVAGLLMTTTTVIGLKAINWLSLVITPIIAIVTVLMLIQVLKVGTVAQVLAHAPVTGISFGAAVSSMVGGTAVGAVIMPDLCRFIRHWTGGIWVAVIAFLISSTAVTAVGGLAGLATGHWEILNLMLFMGLGAGAFAIVFGGTWTINSLNLYSAVLSIEASTVARRRMLITIVSGILGTFVAFLNILDHFLTFLFYLSIIFVPIAGVLIVDFFLARRNAYLPEAHASIRTFEPRALASWATGAGAAVLGSQGFFTLTRIPALDAILIACVVHAALTFIKRRV
jgi:cytosine permease